MGNERPRKDQVFSIAAEIGDPELRAAYLDEACGDDSTLREQVERLLQHDQEGGSFLESPAAAFAATVTPAPLTEQPGDTIGPYKLLQQIGEGGFGVVYMAEQTEPVRRKVALKIIKPGMDTKEVIARFEAERQALALMDHPNIAKVLDAGATESGRPYFVMELVKGVPVIEYCDKNHLPARDRLKLFVDICHAIQHAHQKGVIHRDLKPSNVMVTLHDGKPVPKVIDFGVSKALSQQLTEKTLFTAYGQMVGTPAYMSPEQAEMSGLDIDTRSDVYSLGVLLYELLTGSTPFDSKRLREAGYAEMQRIIREEEPPKPSTRLTTLGEESAIVSSNRGTDPKKLGQLVRGDLDWIVMKALDKERNRRYETANGFAADVERFLADEPVEACPPSATYRFRKFARRNKAPMAVASVAIAALVLVAIGSLIAAGRFRTLADERNRALIAETDAKNAARNAQQEAEDARDKEEELRIEAQRQTKIATDALTEAEEQRERAEANFTLARSAVDQFLNKVAANELLTVPGLQSLREELLSSAMDFYDSFTEDEANTSELQVELARAYHRIAVIRGELGQKEQSRAANDKSIELYEQLREAGNNSIDVRLGLANAYFRRGRYDDVVSLCQEILDEDDTHAGTRSLLAGTYNSLAIADKNEGDIAPALAYHQKALALREGLVRDFPEDARYLANLGGTVNNLGVLLAKQGQNGEALGMFERAVGYSAEAYSKAPQTIMWGRWLGIGLRNVAYKQKAFGEQNSALKSFQRALAIRRKLAFENPAVPALKGELYKAWIDLGNYQRELNLSQQANRSFRAAREVLENIPRETPDELFELAVVYGALATPAEGAAEEPNEDELAEQQQNADLAVETMAQAIEQGYRNVNALQTHKSLAVLQEREDFQQLVVRLEKTLQAERLSSTEADTDTQKLADRRQAVDVLRQLISDDPAEIRHQKTLAAALQSVGEIQLGLKRFEAGEESLHEALEIRRSLLNERPDEPELVLDALAVEYSLGRWNWLKTEYSQAHRRWQSCLDELLQLAEANRDDSELQKKLSIQERQIYQHYGQIGLFPLVLEYAARSVEFDRVWSHADVTQLASEGEFSAVMLASPDGDLPRSYYRQIGDSLRNADFQWKFDVIHLVRSIAALGEIELLSEELLAHYRTHLEESPHEEWIAVGMAMVHYRHDRYAEAQSAIEKFRESHTPQLAFLDAAIASKLGERELAQRRWSEGESRYRQMCRATLVRDVTEDNKSIFGQYWWQYAYDEAMRRLALEAMSEEVTDDPWQHLIQARGYRLIGEIEKAEAELAAAEAAAPEDRDVLMARVRLLGQWEDERQAVEEGWQKVVDLANDDPMPWIHRGRWYAERGEHEKADADFAKAASLTPDELNKFLDAGWWIVGPYPDGLPEFCPPEIDPDPSKPVRIINRINGLSDDPVPWQSVAVGELGRFKPGEVLSDSRGTAYAQAYVFSPEERSHLLLIGKAQPMRVWVNGELVTDFVPGEFSDQPYYDDRRIPIRLREGKNSILVKSAADEFKVRLGDSPRDRILALSEQMRFTKALQEFDAAGMTASDLGPVVPYWFARWLARSDAHRELYEDMCRRLASKTTPNVNMKSHIISVCLQRPNSVFDEHRQRLLNYAAETKERVGTGDVLSLAALANYRAGRLEEARTILRQAEDAWAPEPGAWKSINLPLLALIEHASGNASLAEQALTGACQFADEFIVDMQDADRSEYSQRGPFGFWYDCAQFCSRLVEAEEAIRGGTAASDELTSRLGQVMAEKWAAAPDLVPYDRAVYFEARHTQGMLLNWHALCARGRRLAELGRIDEAEADFSKAVQLAAGDPSVLTELAGFYADRGDVEQSAAKAVLLLKTAPRHDERNWMASPLYQHLFQRLNNRDDIFTRIAERRPVDDRLWIERARFFARRDEWSAAAEHYGHVVDLPRSLGNGPREYACALILAGRGEDYVAACQQFLRGQTDMSLDYPACWDCSLLPNPEIDQARLISVMLGDPEYRDQPHYHAALAVASIGAGRPEHAVPYAEEAARVGDHRVPASFILALAHHRMDQFEKSSEWYTEGVNLLRTPEHPESAILTRMWAKALYYEAMREIEPEKWQELHGQQEQEAITDND